MSFWLTRSPRAPFEDPKSRSSKLGLQYSYGVDYETLSWIYFFDPPTGLDIRHSSHDAARYNSIITSCGRAKSWQLALELLSEATKGSTWGTSMWFLLRVVLGFWFWTIRYYPKKDLHWSRLGNVLRIIEKGCRPYFDTTILRPEVLLAKALGPATRMIMRPLDHPRPSPRKSFGTNTCVRVGKSSGSFQEEPTSSMDQLSLDLVSVICS